MQVTSRHNNDERKEVSGSFFFKLLQNQANAVFIGKFGSNSGDSERSGEQGRRSASAVSSIRQVAVATSVGAQRQQQQF